MNSTLMYGQCSRCGGSLTNGHKCECIQAIEAAFPKGVQTNNRLAEMIRIYASVHNISNKELAKRWLCSESTVSRFLNDEKRAYPDAQTMCRIVAWVLV